MKTRASHYFFSLSNELLNKRRCDQEWTFHRYGQH